MAEKCDVQLAAEILRRRVFHGAADACTGIVDEQVNPAFPAEELVDGGGNGGGVAEVEGKHVNPVFGFGGGMARCPVDAHTPLQKGFSNGAADAGRRAGHQTDAVGLHLHRPDLSFQSRAGKPG